MSEVQPDLRQQFIARTLTETPEVKYDPMDFAQVRGLLYKNVFNAVRKRFPLYNEQHVLDVENLEYSDPDSFTIKQQKEAILNGQSLGRRLTGNWVLKDAVTGEELQRSGRKTIMRVPHMTERGTFIKNGHEYTFSNIMRLEPGVYTRKAGDGTIAAQFNVEQGTGSGFALKLEPDKGRFIIERGGTRVPAYTVYKDMGISDDEMRGTWGDELFEINRAFGTTGTARNSADALYGGKPEEIDDTTSDAIPEPQVDA